MYEFFCNIIMSCNEFFHNVLFLKNLPVCAENVIIIDIIEVLQKI